MVNKVKFWKLIFFAEKYAQKKNCSKSIKFLFFTFSLSVNQMFSPKTYVG